MNGTTIIRFGFGALALAIFAYGAYDALSFPQLARYMPLTVATAGLLLTALNLGVDLRALRNARGNPLVWGNPEDALSEKEGAAGSLRVQLRYAAWVLFFVALMAVIGVLPAVTLFTLLFLRGEAKMTWPAVLASALLATAALMGLGTLLELHWPTSLVDEFVLSR